MDEWTIDDKLRQHGIQLDKDVLAGVITLVITVIFIYALLRALYQWLAPKLKLPEQLGRILLINECYQDTELKQSPKHEWRTFLLVSSLVLASHFLIYYIGYIYRVVQSVNSGYSSYGFFSSFMNIWNQWDTPHYIDVARDWYVTEAQVTQGDAYLFIVFFPLLPLLMRISGFLVPGATDGFYFAAGCIISNLAMCVGSFYFFRLVRDEYDKKTAVWALLFLLFTPAAFFFGICYTEALFLCLCVMFFYYLRKGKYVIAGVLGAFAAFTRSLGVLLAIPFFVEWFDRELFIKQPVKKKLARLAPIFIVTLGILAYLWLNYSIYGDALKFMEYQKHWQQSFTFFASNLGQIGQRIFFYESSEVFAMWLPEFLVIVGTIVLFLVGSGNKMRPSYLAFIMVYIVFGAAPAWLLSGVRYFAVLFPVFILLALFARKHKVMGTVLLSMSFVAMVAYALAFVWVPGMPVM